MTSAHARRTRGIRALVSALLAAGFLWWFLHGVSLVLVAAEIRRVRISYLAAATALSLAGFAFRIWRWRYLVAPLKWTRVGSLAAAVFVGSAVTAILPGRLGEMARAVLLGRREGIRVSAAFGTIVLERLLDVFALLLLLAISLALVPATTPGSDQTLLMLALRTGASVASGALVLIAAGILAARHVPSSIRVVVRTWTGKLPGALGRLGWEVAESFGAGLSGAFSDTTAEGVTPRRLRSWIAVHTALLWAMICGVHLLLFQAFGIEGSFFNVPPLLFLITLGLSVPVPAALGSYHKAVQFGLTVMLGVSAETAAGYAIVSHAVTLVPPALIGVILLAREGIALSSMVNADS